MKSVWMSTFGGSRGRGRGNTYKASRFPVVFFTKNPCRRTPDANEMRLLEALKRKRKRSVAAALDAS